LTPRKPPPWAVCPLSPAYRYLRCRPEGIALDADEPATNRPMRKRRARAEGRRHIRQDRPRPRSRRARPRLRLSPERMGAGPSDRAAALEALDAADEANLCSVKRRAALLASRQGRSLCTSGWDELVDVPGCDDASCPRVPEALMPTTLHRSVQARRVRKFGVWLMLPTCIRG
jgi:hypothetical protein